MAYYYKVQIQRNLLRERLIRNADSAIQLLLASATETDTLQTSDLYGKGEDSVTVRKGNWGMFEVANVRAFSHRDTVHRTLMSGAVADSLWSAALYLLDQGRPITLAGSTLIKGTAYLPEAGPKRGWVDAKNYDKEKLVYGDIKKSSNRMPSLREERLKRLTLQVDYKKAAFQYTEDALQTDSLIAPFDRPCMQIGSKGKPLSIGNIILKGNILLVSDTLILVSAQAKLQNVLLSAPAIKFEAGFQGKVQAFATDSILTGENCQFQYPSSLVLLEMDSSENKPRLVLEKGSLLQGIAMVYVTFLDRSMATLAVRKGAEVQGQIYSDGLMQMDGTLFGTLVCSKLLLSLPSGIYENHLLDCTIDRSKLSPYFLGSSLFPFKRKGIVQWLE